MFKYNILFFSLFHFSLALTYSLWVCIFIILCIQSAKVCVCVQWWREIQKENDKIQQKKEKRERARRKNNIKKYDCIVYANHQISCICYLINIKLLQQKIYYYIITLHTHTRVCEREYCWPTWSQQVLLPMIHDDVMMLFLGFSSSAFIYSILNYY